MADDDMAKGVKFRAGDIVSYAPRDGSPAFLCEVHFTQKDGDLLLVPINASRAVIEDSNPMERLQSIQD